jgi:sigma-B regulation protein RsbU (phosphoserine phosphatase)
MPHTELQARLERKELELNALLEITQAINSNVSEDSLYKIFNFTLRSNLNIRKLALYVFDKKWNCKVNFGSKVNFLKVPLDDRFHLIKQVHQLTEFEGTCDFHEFDMVIPVAHQSDTLAVFSVC